MVRAVAGLNPGRVPAQVLQRTEQVVADTISVSAAGMRSPEIAALIAADEADGLVTRADAAAGPGHAASLMTWPARRAHPAHAAFLNATAGTSLELDEGIRPTGHPAMHVVPAALAVAERVHAPGGEFLRAVLAGYEAAARLFRAYRLAPGVHPHGHFGAIGAAVAAALLSGADPVAAARVAATTPVLAVWQSCYEGATARNSYTGNAAHAGVRAPALAKAGFSGAGEALDVAFGKIAGEIADESILTEPLNYADFAIQRNYFKVHSSCALSHTAIEAALQLHGHLPGNIEHVEVETVTVNLKIDRLPAPNSLSARFSLPYAVATALLLGRSDIDAFRYRPELAELARKVHVTVDAELDAQYPDAAPARVTVSSASGSRTAAVTNPRGHWSRPLTDTQRWEKFSALVAEPRVAEAWWGNLSTLRALPDCAALLEVR
jgi:2-methylcitrate dehydratase PrpD